MSSVGDELRYELKKAWRDGQTVCAGAGECRAKPIAVALVWQTFRRAGNGCRPQASETLGGGSYERRFQRDVAALVLAGADALVRPRLEKIECESASTIPERTKTESGCVRVHKFVGVPLRNGDTSDAKLSGYFSYALSCARPIAIPRGILTPPPAPSRLLTNRLCFVDSPLNVPSPNWAQSLFARTVRKRIAPFQRNQVEG